MSARQDKLKDYILDGGKALIAESHQWQEPEK